MTSPAVLVPAALLIAAGAVDLRTREIPDAFPLLLLAWAVAARLLGLQPPQWLEMVAGLGLALGLGAGLFALGGLGGGDAKLLAALGAVLGLRAFLVVLVYIALIGGVLALVARFRGRREVVYGPAIALGYVAAVIGAALAGADR